MDHPNLRQMEERRTARKSRTLVIDWKDSPASSLTIKRWGGGKITQKGGRNAILGFEGRKKRSAVIVLGAGWIVKQGPLL